MPGLQDAGPSPVEETEQRLQWKIRDLRERVDQANADAARWRDAFHDAMYYLAVVSPPLAEIADDDHFRRWRADVS